MWSLFCQWNYECIFWVFKSLLIHATWLGRVCACEKSFLSTVPPQHPDEVSLIGSLRDSSAAFSQWIPAHHQQVGSDGAAVSQQAKDGGYCFLFSSTLCFPFTPPSYKCGQALTGRKKQNTKACANAVHSFSWAAALSQAHLAPCKKKKPSVCHPRIIVACLLPASSKLSSSYLCVVSLHMGGY